MSRLRRFTIVRKCDGTVAASCTLTVKKVKDTKLMSAYMMAMSGAPFNSSFDMLLQARFASEEQRAKIEKVMLENFDELYSVNVDNAFELLYSDKPLSVTDLFSGKK